MTDFEVTDDLPRRFGSIDSIGSYSEQLREEADRVAEYNIKAGGSDAYGRQYHDQVDPATEQMSQLLDGFGSVFHGLSGSGLDAVRGINNADEAAGDEARHW